jgi:hypothetical protein
MTYKINEFQGSYSIQLDNMSIPRSTGNSDYNRFIEAIALGTDTVEGPDIVSESYSSLRASDYPSMQEQLDMQYWDAVNGTTTWKDRIDEIKALYPKTIERTVTVGDVPAWVQEEADAFLAAKQLREYAVAVERLAQYVVAEGRAEVKETVVIGTETVLDENDMPTYDEEGNAITRDITEEVVAVTAIDPVDATVTVTTFSEETGESVSEVVENPVITQDVAERASAQAIVDATPQAVIDTYNA